MKTLINYYVRESMDFDKIELIQTCVIVGGIAALIFLAEALLFYNGQSNSRQIH